MPPKGQALPPRAHPIKAGWAICAPGPALVPSPSPALTLSTRSPPELQLTGLSMAPARTPTKLSQSLQGGGQEAPGPRSERALLQASRRSPDSESLARAVTRRGTPENDSQRVASPSTSCAVAAAGRVERGRAAVLSPAAPRQRPVRARTRRRCAVENYPVPSVPALLILQ